MSQSDGSHRNRPAWKPTAGPGNTDAAKADAARDSPASAGPPNSYAAKDGPANADAAKVGPASADPAKTDAAKVGLATAGPAKARPAKARPAKAGPAKANPVGPAKSGQGRYNQEKGVRRLARERVGTPRSSRVIEPKQRRKKPKYRKRIEPEEAED